MDTAPGLSGHAAAPLCARGTLPRRGAPAPLADLPEPRGRSGAGEEGSEQLAQRSGDRSLRRTHLAQLGRWAGPAPDHAHGEGLLGGAPPTWVSRAPAPRCAGQSGRTRRSRPAPAAPAPRRAARQTRGCGRQNHL